MRGTRRQTQANLFEFEASLDYSGSSKTASAIEKACLKNETKQQKGTNFPKLESGVVRFGRWKSEETYTRNAYLSAKVGTCTKAWACV